MHHFAEYIADLLIALSDIESNVTAVAPCGDGKILCITIKQLATKYREGFIGLQRAEHVPRYHLKHRFDIEAISSHR